MREQRKKFGAWIKGVLDDKERHSNGRIHKQGRERLKCNVMRRIEQEREKNKE